MALCTRLWPTGAQLRHHYWLGACSGDMTKCTRRHIANGSPHTSHGTARLTEWADSGTRSQWAPMVKRSTPREKSVGALEWSHTHSHRLMRVHEACGVCNARNAHHTPATSPVIAPHPSALVHFGCTSKPCALECTQPGHNYGTTTSWVRVLAPRPSACGGTLKTEHPTTLTRC